MASNLRFYKDCLHNAAARIAELEKQRDELLKDAERYRWLCGEAESIQGRFIEWETSGGDYGERDLTLDAAIDAAIASVKKHKPNKFVTYDEEASAKIWSDPMEGGA